MRLDSDQDFVLLLILWLQGMQFFCLLKTCNQQFISWLSCSHGCLPQVISVGQAWAGLNECSRDVGMRFTQQTVTRTFLHHMSLMKHDQAMAEAAGH